MPRYIDADALKAKYEQMIPEIGDGYHKETLHDVLFELEYAPTISPDEVRGVGEWEEIKVIPKAYDICGVKTWASKMQCRNCGFTTFAIEGRFSQYRYCPSCGARMKGAEDG